jgi:hypothetical protein
MRIGWIGVSALATIESDSTARHEFRAGAYWCISLYQRRKGEIQMKNPLDSLWGTVISGLVLTVILYFVVKSILG